MFGNSAEVRFQFIIEDNDCFTEQQAAFCAADAENVAVGSNICHGKVVGRSAKSVAQTGAVDKEIKSCLTANRIQLGEFFFGIHAADFRRLGDINHLRLRPVFTAGVGIVFLPGLGYLLCGKLAISRGQRQYSVPYMFDSACLMGIDMAGDCAVNCLMRTQGGADDSKVGLGAADEEMYVGIRAGKGLFYQLTCFFAVRVKAVACCLSHISSGQLC